MVTQKDSCQDCQFGRLVRLPVGETHEGVHSSDRHLDMYVCQMRRALHYGHLLVGDHSCLGFQERDVAR